MNDQRRNAEERQRAMRQFLDLVSKGALTARDRFGNTMEVGQRVMLKTDVDLMFDIIAVTPEMDPKAPPGLLNVMLTATFPMTVKAGIPYAKVHIIGMAEAASKPAVDENANGNQGARPTLVIPPGSEARESQEAQTGDDLGDRTKPRDDPESEG